MLVSPGQGPMLPVIFGKAGTGQPWAAGAQALRQRGTSELLLVLSSLYAGFLIPLARFLKPGVLG